MGIGTFGWMVAFFVWFMFAAAAVVDVSSRHALPKAQWKCDREDALGKCTQYTRIKP